MFRESISYHIQEKIGHFLKSCQIFGMKYSFRFQTWRKKMRLKSSLWVLCSILIGLRWNIYFRCSEIFCQAVSQALLMVLHLYFRQLPPPCRHLSSNRWDGMSSAVNPPPLGIEQYHQTPPPGIYLATSGMEWTAPILMRNISSSTPS